MKRLLLAIVTVVGLSACSETLSYRNEGGRCIERDENYIFGLRIVTSEWEMTEDGASTENPCETQVDE